ncbi:probable sphingolipid transporter spinster homolog 2 isoform X2 [Lathyrus oleraceus]|uniref:Major facilitator superfamily (MFS) profile domain-containing protein n=2 Tax=Pisum sativum TaxID=3888 RepID=A0A9D5BR43_PEA|nr:probable sphingolipid transporter spinster homolog 2 isoform X2 [Pisum sativum]KAI5448283.1 hypothetical protein KIW84_015635 [Pisum sativum]
MEPSIISPTIIPTTSWCTPKRLLAIFCVINLLTYLDRGAIASNGVNGSKGTCTKGAVTCTSGTGIQGDFNLNNFEDGVLSSAFLVGIMVASPIFASLTKSVNPFRLIGVGLSVWTLATLFCGFSFDFWSISVCRMLVGVGEASFVSLAAPFIDDNAPASQKTAWLAVFYMCLPLGYATGYIYGGLVGSHFGWRYAFWIESALMLPFAISGFLMNPLELKGLVPADLIKAEVPEDKSNSTTSKAKIFDEFSRFWIDMKALLLNKVYVINVLGYIAYDFVLGAYSYWGPRAGYNIYHMTDADLVFGGIGMVCGIVGTLAGGFALDFMNNSNTLSNAFQLLSVTTLFGAAFCFGAFLCGNVNAFLALLSIGELIIFATQGPVNYVCLHCVEPSLRPLSMAMLTVAIHLFGDLPSSPLVGLLLDRTNNWRTTSLILTTILFPAAGIWFIGIFVHSVDRFEDDSENQVCTIPLLQEKTEETSTSNAQSQEC